MYINLTLPYVESFVAHGALMKFILTVSALDVNKSHPTVCGILCCTRGTDEVYSRCECA